VAKSACEELCIKKTAMLICIEIDDVSTRSDMVTAPSFDGKDKILIAILIAGGNRYTLSSIT